jgi:hypothetical protein
LGGDERCDPIAVVLDLVTPEEGAQWVIDGMSKRFPNLAHNRHMSELMIEDAVHDRCIVAQSFKEWSVQIDRAGDGIYERFR